MRELKVEDALLYLDQVKVEFGDRPQIYNEFLDIMKTFKTQQIDTPGVIRRVSTLFQGNRKLVLGFNTFLPEGYKIELPLDGDGPPVAVFRAPGSTITHILHSSPTGPPGPAAGGGLSHIAQMADARSRGGPILQAPAPQPLPHHKSQEELFQRAVLDPQARDSLHQQQLSLQQRDVRDQMRTLNPPQARHQQPGQHPMFGNAALDGSDHQQKQQQQQQQQQQQHQGLPPPPHPQQQQSAAEQPQQQQGPMEFDHAINYVTNIKKRFANDPETYKKFLEILHTYQKEQRGIKEVLDEVSSLFEDHPDLLKEFTFFLPDAVQAQAKTQLEAAARVAEERKRLKAKQAIMEQAQGMQRQAQTNQRAAPRDFNQVVVPFGATQGRSGEQEAQIIRSAHFGVVSFAPRLPKKTGELTPTQAAAKYGRPASIPELPRSPNTSESTFFQRAKMHLNRRELAADKPGGSRRHTPYTEFLKCLHLFGAGILNKEELVLLLRGLFMQGHAPKTGVNAGGGNANPVVAADATELLREFEEVLIGRGPFADHQNAIKSRSKYGTLRVQDFDFTSDRATPSYRYPPADYPQSLFLSHPGQEEEDVTLINSDVLCVAGDEENKLNSSLEEYNGVRTRRNTYEEEMFRIEDERYEVDMAIERNAQAMRQIEPFAEEVQNLKEQEEKDGQPIGRLQYQLNRYALNTIHINAIGRIYGDQGDEVLQHLLRNPLMVLPIVYQRLKQKDAEWRSAKVDLIKRWKSTCEANYEGSRDVLCYFYRREVERQFGTAVLLEECKRARSFNRHPEKNSQHVAVQGLVPAFGERCLDDGAFIFEPFVSVCCPVNTSHKDALQLIINCVRANKGIALIDRERIGRIFAEFMVPWFGYPTCWVMDEVRDSFCGKANGSVVKFAQGLRVNTTYGEGTINGIVESNNVIKYKVKLPFGMAYLSVSAILHAIQDKATPFVRRDGSMVVGETSSPGTKLYSEKLDDKYQLLFGTESVYLFLRRFSLLCQLLSNIRELCDTMEPPEDPSTLYATQSAQQEQVDVPSSELFCFSAIMANLGKVVTHRAARSEYETFCRKISKETVHQMAALPKLVERCTDCLVEAAKEDVLLYLYDHCQFHQVDPVSVRAQCFSSAPDASFRIQYDTMAKRFYFSYLPRSKELHLSLQPESMVTEEEETPNATADDMESDRMEEIESDDGREPKNRLAHPFRSRSALL